MDRQHCCCFTGHRPGRLPWGWNEDLPAARALKARIMREVLRAYTRGFRHFLCGMAQGTDLYFCQAVIDLKRNTSDVSLEAAIPFPGQADHWPPADQERRRTLLLGCDFETVVQHHYSPSCMARRNRYMVDRSALLLAVYDGDPRGGTAGTVAYALTQGLETVILDPAEF